jgi:hypothetical protein
MVDVSIVITTYNSRDYLKICIDSIKNNTPKYSREMIVVDDASTDGTQELVQKQYPEINYIRNSENIGYVRSNNIGIRASKGRYVLCLNNDALVLDGAINKLIDFMEINKNAGADGPKLLNSDKTIQLQCRRSFPAPMSSLYYFSGLSSLFPKNKLFGKYLLTYLDDKSTMEVDCLCGAAMVVRRDVLDKVGLMDESFFMYGDDIDWCYRIKQAGWKIYYVPEAEMIHYGGRGGSRKQSYRNIFEFYRAMTVYYRKHYAKKFFLPVNWLVYAGIWLKCAVSLAQNLLRKEKYVGTKKP